MIPKVLGYFFVSASVVIIVAVIYLNSEKSNIPIIFSPTQMLAATWNNYKETFLEPATGRTIDPARNLTTSEGEGYTMLRAVWEGDKETFDQSWTWTKNNLQHKSGDHLFAWKFGKKTNGRYGILTTEGGDTSASDADTNITLALLFAYARWQDHGYLGDARVIMSDIWDKEVVTINGEPVLVADNKEKTLQGPTVTVNPSYFNPAAYKIFSQFDDKHPWQELSASSYSLIAKSISATLNNETGVLPPDWIRIDRKTGAISLQADKTFDTNFSFDAMRVPWMLSLDIEWFKSNEAEKLLDQFSFLEEQWVNNKKINNTYSHSGLSLDPGESPAIYGSTIAYFTEVHPESAKNVYEDKLLFLYDPGLNSWKAPLAYYDANWAWFGIALYNHLLPNETAMLPQKAFIQ